MDTISKLNKYRAVIEINDFIDFLYSQKLINEQDFYTVWKRPQRDRLYDLFRLLDSKEDLDSVFIYLKNCYPNTDRENEQRRVHRLVSVRGGFPRLPPNYVQRKSLVDDVRHQILNLQWNKKLVIYGMMGYGKSCLVNDILNDNIVRNNFNNCLFWINLGDCHDKENVLQPMLRLYNAAGSVIENKTTASLDVQILKDLLEKLFLDPRLSDALIILDDACSDVLSYFDIGCKCVITTQNKTILRQEDAIFIEVRTGFSKEESMELFKKSLNITWELNGPAEEIHNICQGHPMLIAHIGSYLQENADAVKSGNLEIWNYIKEMFLRGNYTLNEYEEESVNISHIIEKCIEKLLTNNLKELYADLAIFEQDVNIPSKVLEILWNKAPFEVRNIMNKFAEKSLIVTFYHHSLQTNIYGIHDIHLNYLKNETKDKIVHLHRKLITGYDTITNSNYADLPDDNYSFQFIGYHLYKAEEFGKFNIYFDFKFLERKLKVVGKEDVLRDMQKYEVYITRNDHLLVEKLKQYKDFIIRCGGSMCSYEESDIIQYALRENKDSIVFKDALCLAKKSPYLYFQLQKPADELDYSQIINIKEDITTACFVDSPQRILFGTSNGEIKLFYERSVKEISSFVGHRDAVRHLILSPNKDYFLSVSDDQSVLLFKFAADSTRNSFDGSYGTSPRTKQSFWQDIHTPDKGKIQAKKRFKADDVEDFLISAAFCNTFPYTYNIVTGSNRGKVVVWNAFTGEVLFKTGVRGHSAQCVMYNAGIKMSSAGLEMNTVTFTCDDHIYTYELKKDDLVYYQNLYNQVECKSLFSLKDSQLVVVGDKNITLWRDLNRFEVYKVTEDKNNICSTITSDQQYLIVSTDKGTVYVYDIEKQKLVKEFGNKGLAKSLDTFYDQDKSVHILLIGSDRKTLQQCHIQPFDTEPQVESIPVFTPHWKNKNPQTALVNKDNQIQIFSGYIQISETDVIASQVKCTCFSLCGSIVIYGLASGEIFMFHMKNRKTLLIDNENKNPVTYLKCYDPNGSFRTPGINVNGSTNCVEFSDEYIGSVICTTSKTVIVYRNIYNKEKIKIVQTINRPNIFYQTNHLIILDEDCNLFLWNIDTNLFNNIKNSHLPEGAVRLLSCFCLNSSIIAISYKKDDNYFMGVYQLEINKCVVHLCRQLELANEVRSSCFSADGSLLAVGFNTGEIIVWNLNSDYKNITLTLHNECVQDLLFSPNLEPILVSLGEEIAWWNLISFHKRQGKLIGKPSIRILNGISSDMENMNLSFWTERRPIPNNNHLLSCIKLQGKARYMSASNDFKSFLTIDDSGKVYIMEVIDNDI